MTSYRADESHLIGAIGETSALLSNADVQYWPSWLDKIAERVRQGDGVAIAELLQSYAGMGSFNDLYLCSHNGHAVSAAEEAVVNERFDSLRSELYRRATSLAASFSSPA